MTHLLTNSPVLPVLILLSSALLGTVIAWRRPSLSWPFTISVVAVVTAISGYNLVRVLREGPIHYYQGNWAPPIGIEYVLDHLSAFVMLVVNTVALLVLFHARVVVKAETPGKELGYYGTALLMLCGFNGIIITGDLFNLYVFLEIGSLSLYGLIAVGERKAPIAAFRYLVMGTLAGCFYLLGIGFLYMKTGSLNMADTAAILPSMLGQPAVLVGLMFVFLGMGIKMALFPLHGWLPDAYTYAPSASSALIAPIGTKVGAYVLLRLVYFVFGITIIARTLPVAKVICWLAAAGIIYGSILAIAQRELKRMLAYSSIAQIGYVALGIGMANRWALTGAILHIMNHAFMKGCLFLTAANFRRKLGHSDISRFDWSIRKKMPWTMAAFSISALSMIGLPPMAGFFSKLFLAMGAVNGKHWIFLVVILFSSLLNAVYFFRVLEKAYLKPAGDAEAADGACARDEAVPSMLIPTLIMALLLIILGLLSTVIADGILAHIAPPGL